MAQRNDARREEIFASVYSLLDQSPYDKVSLSDIARGAGISKSLLQRYYPQKLDIIREMLTTLLHTAYSYMDSFSYDGRSPFLKISDFNMLFFAAADQDFQLRQFVLATVASPEILDVWIDTICSWLRRYVSGMPFTMLQLRCALCFSMGGSMHLFQHQEELGIDYQFFCRNHIRSIMELLHYSNETIEDICSRTDQWIRETDVEEYLQYCRKKIPWLA